METGEWCERKMEEGGGQSPGINKPGDQIPITSRPAKVLGN